METTLDGHRAARSLIAQNMHPRTLTSRALVTLATPALSHGIDQCMKVAAPQHRAQSTQQEMAQHVLAPRDSFHLRTSHSELESGLEHVTSRAAATTSKIGQIADASMELIMLMAGHPFHGVQQRVIQDLASCGSVHQMHLLWVCATVTRDMLHTFLDLKYLCLHHGILLDIGTMTAAK
jgi:hypothetical protein